MYLISPDPSRLAAALEAWRWIGLDGKKPIRVTAFADVFFKADDGIWFLDTLEGSLTKVCESEEMLDRILASEDGKDRYLLAGLVDRAAREAMTLEDGQCLDFRINPVLGGTLEFTNVQRQDLVVAMHIAGQIHEQVRNLPAGTKIRAVTVDGPPTQQRRPWWRFW